MNMLDKEILKELLMENLSIYQLHKRVGVSYPTVLRHVNRLLKEEYISRRKGEKRNAFCLSLTPKGLVMLVFEGDIGKNWASAKENEESFEELLKMLDKIARRSKGESYES